MNQNTPALAKIEIELTEEMDADKWREIGLQLGAVDQQIPWIVGDWARFGVDNYHNGRIMIEEILNHYSSDRISKLMYVAERFQLHRRRTDLSFSHHQAVAPLPDQHADHLLAQAALNRLSVRDVKAQARFVTNQIKGITAASTEKIQADLEDRPDQITQLCDLFSNSYATIARAPLNREAVRTAVASVLAQIGWKPS